MTDDASREYILERTERFAEREFAEKPFVPGESPVLVSGRVFGPEEVRTLVDASLDFWLTAGRFNDAFESEPTCGFVRGLSLFVEMIEKEDAVRW